MNEGASRGGRQMSGTGHTHEVAIIGAGFGGLCMAIRLLGEGIRDFVILEKAQDVGGTWRENTYPGAACDVQSHFYSYSFDGKPDWSARYAGWQEIQDYIREVTERHGLRPLIRFGRTVNSLRFDAGRARWTVGTAEGEAVVARHVVMASGPLHVPAIPDIPGLASFRGKVMHSAQWDHGYDFAGKRVASIGTGGSAIQYAPAIAPDVGQLHVFQRSAAWVIPRDTRSYTEQDKQRFARFPWLRRLHRSALYWLNESRLLGMLNPAIMRRAEAMALSHMRRAIADPELQRKLTPDYRFGCKRVLISNDWYPMFNRPNVDLVTEGIREIRPDGIVTADGVERKLDCIVLGTGFVTDPRVYLRNTPITGLPGHTLQEDWKDGAEALYGIHVSGYPNLHILVGPNTGLGHNSIIFMIEAQVHYILQAMRALKRRGADWLAVKPATQQRFVASVQRALKGTVWSSGCASWYLQADGRNVMLWPWTTVRYWWKTRRVVESGYEFARAADYRASGKAPGPRSREVGDAGAQSPVAARLARNSSAGAAGGGVALREP
jgi:cation diffusion facilitator CzcD-associated flavoprotein CzcO